MLGRWFVRGRPLRRGAKRLALCGAVPSVSAQRLIAVMNYLVRLMVHNVFRILIVATINPHETLDPLLGLTVEVITDLLFKEWFAASSLLGLHAKRAFHFHGVT